MSGDSEDIRAMYKQIAEDRRQFDRFTWQLPSLTLAVTGGLATLAFAYVYISIVRASILVLALAWNIAVLIFFLKNYYFMDISIEILTRLEGREMKVPFVVRRHTKIEDTNALLLTIKSEKKVEGRGPHMRYLEPVTVRHVFIAVMIVSMAVLAFLAYGSLFGFPHLACDP